MHTRALVCGEGQGEAALLAGWHAQAFGGEWGRAHVAHEVQRVSDTVSMGMSGRDVAIHDTRHMKLTMPWHMTHYRTKCRPWLQMWGSSYRKLWYWLV